MWIPTFRNVNLELDSILNVAVIITLQMAAEAQQVEERTYMYTAILRSDFSENISIYISKNIIKLQKL